MTSGVITLHRKGILATEKQRKKRPLIFPAKVARAFTTSLSMTVAIAENHNPYIRRIS